MIDILVVLTFVSFVFHVILFLWRISDHLSISFNRQEIRELQKEIAIMKRQQSDAITNINEFNELM
jgi:hypothetical protein